MNAYIFARSGSKGLKNKNIKDFNGKPLIAWSIELAINSNLFEKVIVSTDCSEIAQISESYGAEIPFIRPKALASDKSSEWDAWKHAINHSKNNNYFSEVFVSLPPTSPLRMKSDIEGCINEFNKSPVDAIISITPSSRNPYFNMVTRDLYGNCSIVNSVKDKIFRRQDAPKCFDITTVIYMLRSDYILSADSIFDGTVRGFEIPKNRSIDIDDQVDFDIAKFLHKNHYE